MAGGDLIDIQLDLTRLQKKLKLNRLLPQFQLEDPQAVLPVIVLANFETLEEDLVLLSAPDFSQAAGSGNKLFNGLVLGGELPANEQGAIYNVLGIWSWDNAGIDSAADTIGLELQFDGVDTAVSLAPPQSPNNLPAWFDPIGAVARRGPVWPLVISANSIQSYAGSLSRLASLPGSQPSLFSWGSTSATVGTRVFKMRVLASRRRIPTP
jgi:hypothetical protein